MPNHLLFHAYTKQQVAECRYFLLKYLSVYNLKPPADITPVIYTNEPVAFEGFTSFFTHFLMPDLAMAPGTNVTKTLVLHRFFQQNSGTVLYCITATYPLQPLEHLFADIEKGALYLHTPHRYPETELTKALRKFTSLLDKTATTVTTPPSARVNVWHASVVGLHDRHKPLLDRLLAEETPGENALASDYNYTKVFSETGKVKNADKYIFDYSSFEEFNQLLQVFFLKNEEESIPNQVKALHHIDAGAILQQKEQFRQLPLFKKWLNTLTGKRWSIQQYTNKL